MGLLCCFSAPATHEDKAVISAPSKDVQDAGAKQPVSAEEEPAVVPQQKEVDKPWSKLNETESAAVKQTLRKVRRARRSHSSRVPERWSKWANLQLHPLWALLWHTTRIGVHDCL